MWSNNVKNVMIMENFINNIEYVGIFGLLIVYYYFDRKLHIIAYGL